MGGTAKAPRSVGTRPERLPGEPTGRLSPQLRLGVRCGGIKRASSSVGSNQGVRRLGSSPERHHPRPGAELAAIPRFRPPARPVAKNEVLRCRLPAFEAFPLTRVPGTTKPPALADGGLVGDTSRATVRTRKDTASRVGHQGRSQSEPVKYATAESSFDSSYGSETVLAGRDARKKFRGLEPVVALRRGSGY